MPASTPIGIARAAWTDIRGGSVSQGGSTITQQYVKNVYLTSERTITRKIREAVLSIKIEREMSKEEILEGYLNTIYFGRGAYGIGAGVPGLLRQEPGRARPRRGRLPRRPDPGARARRRRPRARGGDPAPAHASWRPCAPRATSAPTSTPPPTPNRGSSPPCTDGSDGTVMPRTEKQGYGQVRGAQYGTEYFIDYVKTQLNAIGIPDAEIYGSGLRVYTTIDLAAQQMAWDAITATLDAPDTDPLASLVAIDEHGYIRAMIGGRDFTHQPGEPGGARGGGGPGRQAGSAMKPFVLATAIKQGISLQSKFDAPAELVIPKANAGEDWEVHNYGDSEQGILTAARRHPGVVEHGVRPADAGGGARERCAGGAADGHHQPARRRQRARARHRGGLAAGDGERVLDVRQPGDAHQPDRHPARRERRRHGAVGADGARTQVLSEAEDQQVTYALRQVVTGGTGQSADFGRPAAGKTGTTQNYNDAWFVGFTPNGWTAAVWMGYDTLKHDDGSEEAVYMDNVRGRKVTGGSFPATIWRRFMAAWTEGVDIGNFIAPNRFPGEILNPDIDTTTTTLPFCGDPTTTDPSAPCQETTTTTAPTTVTAPPPSTEPPTTVPACDPATTTTVPGPPCDIGD